MSFGWKPDKKFRKNRGAFTSKLGNASSSFKLELPIKYLDQGNTQSCCGHGVGRAIQLRMMTLFGDHSFEQASPRLLYNVARIYEGEPYIDDGTTIGACLVGAEELGFAPLSSCPWDENEVLSANAVPWINTPVDLDVLKSASVQIGLEWEWIDSDRVETTKKLLRAGIPVVIGERVGESYLNNAGELYEMPSGEKILGGHCTCSDFDFDDEGVWFLGSYGPSWAVGGRIKLSWGEIANPLAVQSMVAINAVKKYAVSK